MSNDVENFDEDNGVRCEGCNVNLDDNPCICGPAGPRLDGLWTGENAKTNPPREFEPSREKCVGLARVLREEARKMIDQNDVLDSQVSDVAELLNVLARMVEGKTVYRAFGAPGDWGYGTPIGDALRAAYS